MFRRKPSPRQDTRGGRDRRTQSSSGLQQNGHRRQDSDGEVEIRNLSYGDPDIISSQPSRTRTVISPTTEFNPVVGRHLSPASGRSEDVESAVYVTPADTLNRGVPHSAVQSSSISQASNTSGSGAVADSFSGSRTEKRNMQLHQLTMSQVSKRQQGGGGGTGGEMVSPGTIPAPSKAHVVGQDQPRIQMGEGSEYSIPFNLLQGGDSRPSRSHHHRRVPQAIPPDNECIIPINPHSTSPQSPSDRSDTTSPNSPQSNQSSEHEQQQPQPSRPPDDGDYAIPWDRSRIFQNIPRASLTNSRRHPGSGRRRNEELDDPSTGPSRSRGGSLRDQSSPPLPLATSGYRYQSSGGGDMSQVPPPPPPEDSPPPPDLPYDPNHPWRGRTVSNRIHDNTSPVNAGGWGHKAIVTTGEDFGGRSQSLSGHILSGRRLPTPPTGGGGDWPPRDGVPLPSSVWRQSTPVTIDPSIPLEDQPWYHGNLTRAEAEDVLRDQSDFSFLVRKSESCQTDFSLSIRDNATGCIHLRLVFEEDPSPGYVLGQFSRHFDKVTDCIALYMKQRLNIRGAEHKRLGYPVPRSHAVDKYHNSIAKVGV